MADAVPDSPAGEMLEDGWGVLICANSFAAVSMQILDGTAAVLLRLVLGVSEKKD